MRPDRILAVALAFAIGLSPALLDRCLLACESLSSAAASKADVGHACHRIRQAVAQQTLRNQSERCGHDHGQSGAADDPGSPAAGTAKRTASLRMACALSAPPASGGVMGATGAASGVLPSPESPPNRACLASSALPLRI